MSKYLFVLGAGASQPYGYPTGNALKWKIITDLLNGSGITFEVLKHEFSDLALKNFATCFKSSKLNSIDAFLRLNQDFEFIGKKAIATNILHSQSTSDLDPLGKDWLGYIYNRLIGTEESKLEDPEISFITFNYDHSLELQLHNAIKHSFNLSKEDTQKAFNKIKIHHVYGDIGEFASPLNSIHNLNDYFHFHCNARIKAVEDASTSIKVMYDQREELPDYVKKLFEAKHIYFLGFGFDKLNIQRLGIDWKNYNKQIRVCGLSITDAERNAYLNDMGQASHLTIWGDQSWDCYNFLRHHFV
jgi:hypothetical protein